LRFSDLAVGPSPQLPREAYEDRRARLAKAMGAGDVLVVATSTLKQFSNDVDYPYRPHSDLWYLTGFGEPGAVLVLEGGSGRTALFLRDRKKEAEIWTGRRLGVARAPDALGVDKAYAIEELSDRLPALLKGQKRVHGIAKHDPWVQTRLARAAGRRLVVDKGPPKVGGPESTLLKAKRGPPSIHARSLLHDLRLIKEPAELKMLREACDLGVQAHLDAASRIRPGAREFAVEAAFVHHARSHGSTGVGYPSICGCGPNAAVLHYVTNQDRLRKDRLFLIDAGCEWGWYTSDITRTYPVGGEWTRVQSEMYDLVAAAHKAALREVRPGNAFRAPHQKAVDVITAGLIDAAYIDGPFEAAVKEQTYRRYFMHGTSHWLGLDVHDAGAAVEPDGRPRTLREGMCLTVEPGLYFNPDFSDCPPEAVGIGIRIEDDVAVTADGQRNLTRRLPSEASAVADLVRG
jgi:Xaa-Pro aminopeptidase